MATDKVLTLFIGVGKYCVEHWREEPVIFKCRGFRVEVYGPHVRQTCKKMRRLMEAHKQVSISIHLNPTTSMSLIWCRVPEPTCLLNSISGIRCHTSPTAHPFLVAHEAEEHLLHGTHDRPSTRGSQKASRCDRRRCPQRDLPYGSATGKRLYKVFGLQKHRLLHLTPLDNGFSTHRSARLALYRYARGGGSQETCSTLRPLYLSALVSRHVEYLRRC